MGDNAQRMSKAMRRQRFLSRSHVVKQGRYLLEKASDLFESSSSAELDLSLLDELVHSILFCGYIAHKTDVVEMFADEKASLLREIYPNACEGFKNKLPRRTPFSCLLRLIVEVKGQNDQESVKNEISNIVQQLFKEGSDQLIGSVICITHNGEFQQIFSYGASISKIDRQKKMWIALSCVHTWHPHVSYAVMKCSRGGTVSFPDINASCTAYDARTLEDKPPCASCRNLFLAGNHNPTHLYGNCAEVEAISELFKLNEREIGDDVRAEWRTLQDAAKNELINELKEMKALQFKPDVVYKPLSPKKNKTEK